MYTEYYVYNSGDILITKGIAYVVSEVEHRIDMKIFKAGETWHRNSKESELFLYITGSKMEADDFIRMRYFTSCKRVYSPKVDKDPQYLDTEYDPDYAW